MMVGRLKFALNKTKELCAGNIIPDYQFDVYRMMRAHNQNDWEGFNPLTNVIVCKTR
jgi:Haspin like kinase domain